MYFPIGSFRSFALPIEEPYEIVFIRATRDRLKLVVLTPTIISVWLTKVTLLHAVHPSAHAHLLADYVGWSRSPLGELHCRARTERLRGMAKRYSEIGYCSECDN